MSNTGALLRPGSPWQGGGEGGGEGARGGVGAGGTEAQVSRVDVVDELQTGPSVLSPPAAAP